ncbi:hypothetical protein [Roseobacter sinensis]|uniref:Transmembrane protein n=1 Tax=Roseobacter sinensis TaxID=2931391 RepID=A0ABT3BAX7_9RHOB|nr:hypothetical protein [Roseobacter sp. WL0113]MCV3270564.1 hypothetical protein [Roseobacter sp. WL0113]
MYEIETDMRALKEAVEKHLGIKGASLGQQLRRAGRRLPRHLRAQAGLLAEAEVLVGNPRLLRQLDEARVARALDDVGTYLRGIDRAEARRTRLLSIAAVIAFNLILLFTAVVVVLRLRGLI